MINSDVNGSRAPMKRSDRINSWHTIMTCTECSATCDLNFSDGILGVFGIDIFPAEITGMIDDEIFRRSSSTCPMLEVLRNVARLFAERYNFSYKFSAAHACLDETPGGGGGVAYRVARGVLDLFMSKLSALSRCRVNWELIGGDFSGVVSIAPNLMAALNATRSAMIDVGDKKNR